MNVFISWSGGRSKAVADMLSDWIRSVLQATRPWISTRDIDRGALWFSEINDRLKDTGVGIVCLTQENKNRPWILFETGALAKGLSSNRICTFLVDLEPKDLEDPLAQFNHTLPNREGLWELVQTLNKCLGASGLDPTILSRVFGTYWPQFEVDFKKTLQLHPAVENSEPRKADDILAEILQTTRSLNSRLRQLETSDGTVQVTPRVENQFVQTENGLLFFSEIEKAIAMYRKKGIPRQDMPAQLMMDFGIERDEAETVYARYWANQKR